MKKTVNSPKLAIVVPCYNEELVVKNTAARLKELLQSLIEKELIARNSFIYFVDDGSQDKTWLLIEELHNDGDMFKGLKLSRNFGHQKALLAGLAHTKDHADCIISIDADLQQDENVISEFIEKYQDGAEIVYGVRKNRIVDGLFKRWSALLFYKFQKTMGIKILPNHADYRLLSSRAINTLLSFPEVNLYLRGTIPLLGFTTAVVYHDVSARKLGETKYTLFKMLSLAWDGVTSFSTVPLRLVTIVGFGTFFVATFMVVYYMFIKLFGSSVLPGWASTVLPTYFFGGLQIFCLGLIGEYIAKIYQEVKSRPRYIVEKEVV